MNRFFIDLYGYFSAHRKRLIGSLVLLAAVGLLLVSHTKYKEDISEFLPEGEAYTHLNRLYQHLNRSNRLILHFSARDTTQNDPEPIMEAIDRFTSVCREIDSLKILPEIISQEDESRMSEMAGFVRRNIPYFLTEADYARLDSLLPMSEVAVATLLEEDKRLLMLPLGRWMGEQIATDPLHLFTPVLERLRELQVGNREDLELHQGYLFVRSNGRLKARVWITSPYGVSETAQNARLLHLIDQAMEQTQRLSPGIDIRCFGAPAIAVTNANRIKKDSLLAVSLSVALILLLLIYFFRNLRHIALIFLSVSFGWLFALALLTLFKDSISIIAIGIGSIFIGIAVNYPLHLTDHLRHQPQVRRALKEIIPPLLIGNLTTVGAFLSLVFIPSEAMRDMGWFGSLLLMGTILFVLIYLPHLLKADSSAGSPALPRWTSFAPEKKKWVVCTVLLLTIVFAWFARFTTFESDMNRINYMTPQQSEDMNDLMQSIERTGQEVTYLITQGTTLDEALLGYERNKPLVDSLKRIGLVESVAGAGAFLPSREEQQRRIGRWNDFWMSQREGLLQQLEAAALDRGFKPGSFRPFTQLLSEDFAPSDEAFFAPIITPLAHQYIVGDSLENRYMLIHLLYGDKTRSAELSEALRQCTDGAFAFDSRNIAQRVVDSLSEHFNYVLYVCGCIVFLFLTLSFGRLELSLLAFLPLAVSWIWILGIMHLGDMRFNIVNIILATFIFGQGDDYTIFITEGLMYEYAYRRKTLDSYKNSIILSALMMFTGIGALIFARHPALKSLAEVTIVGMVSVVVITCIIPPLLFHWLTRTGNGYRKVPITLKRLVFSLYSFVCFLAGCLFITLAGFFLLGLGRRRREDRKLRYHAVLRRVAYFVIQRVPGVSFRYENLSGETFEKPAVMICNHRSHLDLMCLMMLTPRLVILTNDWVWNNPFYGKLIRYADFLPVSGGIETCLAALADRVRRGYSIAVFPEGSRSVDPAIRRFHRGAFYLAEVLHLDILPVFIHGAGDVLPKDDFMLRQGRICVQVHPRIPAGDTLYGNRYTLRAGNIRQYYCRISAAISQQIETAAYFKSFVLHNYFYKGAGIAYSVQRLLNKTHCFAAWIDSFRPVSSVLIVNNGYGVLGFLFALVHKQTLVTAIDRDADKVALARHCAGIPPNLRLYEASALPDDVSFEAVYLWNPDERQREEFRGVCNLQIIETSG
ncbi:MAG: 1-acyl-sn-glycerol-3-phosphate acyltransferase [Tannerellaceae bacterium]|jgi:1-acyl-sn-glycerol-3-phosphate acyltransferase|nr:1-acyl-sn-glycerol-3-phosphate acyltransferase [Tannerellaceae bacterium]